MAHNILRLSPYSSKNLDVEGAFTERSKALHFLCGSFMFFLSCVCYAFVRVCLYVPYMCRTYQTSGTYMLRLICDLLKLPRFSEFL